MSKNILKKIIPAILIILIVGYFREIIFVHVNLQRSQLYFNETDKDYGYEFPTWLQFLKHMTYEELNNMKWIMTLAYFMFYFAIAYFLVRSIFKNKNYNKITIAVHVIFFISAGVSYIVGYLTGKGLEGYTLSRALMGILQSPVLIMLLIPAFILDQRQNLKNI